MTAEVVATGLHIPEGPVVLPDGRIAFVEQVLGRVSVFDGTAVTTLAEVGGAANAVTLGEDALYAAQNGGVVGAWRSADPRPPGIQRVRLDGRVEQVTGEVAGGATPRPERPRLRAGRKAVVHRSRARLRPGGARPGRPDNRDRPPRGYG
jgi:hypothetical protein